MFVTQQIGGRIGEGKEIKKDQINIKSRYEIKGRDMREKRDEMKGEEDQRRTR